MPTFRVALAVLCLSAASLFAQTPVVTPHEPPPIVEGIPPAMLEEAIEAERTLNVLQSGRNQQVGTEADVTGAHGELLLESATAPATGLLLRALTSTPDIFFKVGTSTAASAVQVQNSAGTSVFRVRGDGGVQLGAYNWGKFTIASFDDHMKAVYVLQSAGIESNTYQNDTGVYVSALQAPLPGVANTAGVMGGYFEGYNFGSGSVNWSTGGMFRAGNSEGKTGTVNLAYGLQTQVRAAGGTVQTGYGLYIHDTEASATGSYGIYQVGTNDTNYLGGSVVIGPSNVSNPGTKLTVYGDMVATGSITGVKVFNAVYQDIAEWVPASEDMTPGTVVVLSPANVNEVMPSGRPYDTSVAGVVSAQPGVLLGVGGASKEQIATTGRVKVRVDATAAPIRIGDLLVTSGAAGTAMRSIPVALGDTQIHRPGTIIGKALEPLDSGTGEILVLLSLQ